MDDLDADIRIVGALRRDEGERRHGPGFRCAPSGLLAAPGDIQLLNNRRILHNRFDYEDFPERDKRRLMLRLWPTIPGWRKYPPTIPHIEMETSATPA